MFGIWEMSADAEDEPAKSSFAVTKTTDSTEITEESHRGHSWRRENLAVEIPSGTMEYPTADVRINIPPSPIPTPKRVNFSPVRSPGDYKTEMPPGPSSRGTSSYKNFLEKLSFKSKNNSGDHEKALGERTVSLTKLFTPKMKRTLSLPVTPIAHSNPESVRGGSSDIDTLDYGKVFWHANIHRSQSVPELVKDGSNKPTDSGNVIRIIPATPRPDTTATTSNEPSIHAGAVNIESEDIPEEEAVCRICMVELEVGAETFKMECSCKGELALAHKECLVKWFSIKGNKVCEVCKEEVQNLPVTLLRIQSAQSLNVRGMRGRISGQSEDTRYRVWQDVPVLIIVSMLAYFCFLEQLLVGKMQSGAIAISLPFSCILGLLASMTSTTMVKKKYVWLFATVQFGLVVLFAHTFYSKLHMQAVLSVLLSTFAGFGVTMVANSALIETIRWRRRRLAQTQDNQSSHHMTPGDSMHPQSNASQHEFAPEGLPTVPVS